MQMSVGKGKTFRHCLKFLLPKSTIAPAPPSAPTVTSEEAPWPLSSMYTRPESFNAAKYFS